MKAAVPAERRRYGSKIKEAHQLVTTATEFATRKRSNRRTLLRVARCQDGRAHLSAARRPPPMSNQYDNGPFSL